MFDSIVREVVEEIGVPSDSLVSTSRIVLFLLLIVQSISCFSRLYKFDYLLYGTV